MTGCKISGSGQAAKKGDEGRELYRHTVTRQSTKKPFASEGLKTIISD